MSEKYRRPRSPSSSSPPSRRQRKSSGGNSRFPAKSTATTSSKTLDYYDKYDTRYTPKDNKLDNKLDNKYDGKSRSKFEQKYTKYDTYGDKYDRKSSGKLHSTYDAKSASKSDLKYDKYDDKYDMKSSSKYDKFDSNAVDKYDGKSSNKFDSKYDKYSSGYADKYDTKPVPKMEYKTENNFKYKDSYDTKYNDGKYGEKIKDKKFTKYDDNKYVSKYNDDIVDKYVRDDKYNEKHGSDKYNNDMNRKDRNRDSTFSSSAKNYEDKFDYSSKLGGKYSPNKLDKEKPYKDLPSSSIYKSRYDSPPGSRYSDSSKPSKLYNSSNDYIDKYSEISNNKQSTKVPLKHEKSYTTDRKGMYGNRNDSSDKYTSYSKGRSDSPDDEVGYSLNKSNSGASDSFRSSKMSHSNYDYPPPPKNSNNNNSISNYPSKYPIKDSYSGDSKYNTTSFGSYGDKLQRADKGFEDKVASYPPNVKSYPSYNDYRESSPLHKSGRDTKRNVGGGSSYKENDKLSYTSPANHSADRQYLDRYVIGNSVVYGSPGRDPRDLYDLSPTRLQSTSPPPRYESSYSSQPQSKYGNMNSRGGTQNKMNSRGRERSSVSPNRTATTHRAFSPPSMGGTRNYPNTNFNRYPNKGMTGDSRPHVNRRNLSNNNNNNNNNRQQDGFRRNLNSDYGGRNNNNNNNNNNNSSHYGGGGGGGFYEGSLSNPQNSMDYGKVPRPSQGMRRGMRNSRGGSDRTSNNEGPRGRRIEDRLGTKGSPMKGTKQPLSPMDKKNSQHDDLRQWIELKKTGTGNKSPSRWTPSSNRGMRGGRGGDGKRMMGMRGKMRRRDPVPNIRNNVVRKYRLMANKRRDGGRIGLNNRSRGRMTRGHSDRRPSRPDHRPPNHDRDDKHSYRDSDKELDSFNTSADRLLKNMRDSDHRQEERSTETKDSSQREEHSPT